MNQAAAHCQCVHGPHCHFLSAGPPLYRSLLTGISTCSKLSFLQCSDRPFENVHLIMLFSLLQTLQRLLIRLRKNPDSLNPARCGPRHLMSLLTRPQLLWPPSRSSEATSSGPPRGLPSAPPLPELLTLPSSLCVITPHN